MMMYLYLRGCRDSLLCIRLAQFAAVGPLADSGFFNPSTYFGEQYYLVDNAIAYQNRNLN